MLEVNMLLVQTRDPSTNIATRMPDAGQAWLDPFMVDTITKVDFRKIVDNNLPANCAAIVRYRCEVGGYRLFFVSDDPAKLARKQWRLRRGEDPATPDYLETEQ